MQKSMTFFTSRDSGPSNTSRGRLTPMPLTLRQKGEPNAARRLLLLLLPTLFQPPQPHCFQVPPILLRPMGTSPFLVSLPLCVRKSLTLDATSKGTTSRGQTLVLQLAPGAGGQVATDAFKNALELTCERPAFLPSAVARAMSTPHTINSVGRARPHPAVFPSLATPPSASPWFSFLHPLVFLLKCALALLGSRQQNVL